MRPRKGPLLFEEVPRRRESHESGGDKAGRLDLENRRVVRELELKDARLGAGPQKLREHREEVALVAAEDLLGAREGRLVVMVLQGEAKRPLDLSCEEGAESLPRPSAWPALAPRRRSPGRSGRGLPSRPRRCAASLAVSELWRAKPPLRRTPRADCESFQRRPEGRKAAQPRAARRRARRERGRGRARTRP